MALKNRGYSYLGANMDWVKGGPGYVYVKKRGLTKTGLYPNIHGEYAQWTSKYASLTFDLAGYQSAWGGMNEKGLSVSTQGLLDDPIYTPDERPLMVHWLQYILDTCATVSEVEETLSRVNVVTVDHHLICDRSGECGVFEFLAGGPVVHRGPDLPVAAVSNTPYETALANWSHAGFSPLCGGGGSGRRFCTAASRVSEFEPGTTEEAVKYAFDTLHAIRGELYSPHTSHWSMVFDSRNLRAYTGPPTIPPFATST